MGDEEKKFNMQKDNFIICPNCKNDKKFKLIAAKLEPGIYEMQIGCCNCDWHSEDILEECGYFPDMSKDMIAFCVHNLHEDQINEGII